tara:strand:- start:1351 stop:1539 length:189 start_codon:yes stop_codon:yes gene_type:complete
MIYEVLRDFSFAARGVYKRGDKINLSPAELVDVPPGRVKEFKKPPPPPKVAPKKQIIEKESD